MKTYYWIMIIAVVLGVAIAETQIDIKDKIDIKPVPAADTEIVERIKQLPDKLEALATKTYDSGEFLTILSDRYADVNEVYDFQLNIEADANTALTDAGVNIPKQYQIMTIVKANEKAKTIKDKRQNIMFLKAIEEILAEDVPDPNSYDYYEKIKLHNELRKACIEITQGNI